MNVHKDQNSGRVFYDNANIAESYSGIVLPLTFSFASSMYSRVYKDLLRASGVSTAKINSHQEVFDNLLAHIHGRMYYNMNNWYRINAFVPGYERNKRNFETMISSNIRENLPRDITPSKGLTICYPVLVMAKLLVFPITVRRFIRSMQKAFDDINTIDIDALDEQKCKELYRQLQDQTLPRWYITVENDVIVMTLFGMLQKRFSQSKLSSLLAFDTPSTRQIQSITDLMKALKSQPQLWQNITDRDATQFYNHLKSAPQLKKQLHNYFERFGGRFANELKLESPDLENDFEYFARTIEMYASREDLNTPEKHKNSLEPQHVSFRDRMILSAFRRAARRREQMRLLRSRSFSIARRIFRRIGVIYSHEGLINKPDDIFYCTLDQVLTNNIEVKRHLQDHIRDERKRFEYYACHTLPSFFNVAPNEEPPATPTKHQSPQSTLTGSPCTRGTLTGTVKVLEEFSVPDKVDFDILVAKHTDPGWTPLIGSVRGMIIEHGGMLSHAAIVSRELGLPTVIGAHNATQILQDGQTVRINGATGTIDILSS